MAADSGKASDDLTVASESIEADVARALDNLTVASESIEADAVKDLGNLTVGPGPLEADFVRALGNFTVALDPIEQYNRGDYAFSSFPVFALSSQVSESDLQQAAKVFNDQARYQIGMNEEEYTEMGHAATVPESWDLHLRGQSERDAAHWHLENFDKRGSGTVEIPQWFPHGFLAIVSKDWKETGVVLVFYNTGVYWDPEEPREDKSIPVVSFVMNPKEVGAILITLRQTDDWIENVESAFGSYIPQPSNHNFVKALNNLTVKPELLEPYRASDSLFAAFPVFALSAQVSKATLQQFAKYFNDQAQALLCCDDEQFAEVGHPAAVPEHWQLHKKTALDEQTALDGQTALDAAHWYPENFDRIGSGTAELPQWFPFGFLGIMSNNWMGTRVVFVFYDFHKDKPLEDKSVPVVAFVANPERVGEMLCGLRQGDESIDGVKMAGSGYTVRCDLSEVAS
jgi:hypothetical protein